MHGQNTPLAETGQRPDPLGDAGKPQADRQRLPELRRGEPDMPARAVQPALQGLDVFPQVVPAGARVLQLVVHDLSPVVRRGVLDAVRKLGQPVAAHALPADGLGHPAFEHRGGAAELGADALRLLHEHLEHPILRALGIEEVAAEDLPGRLELPVDAAVALVEAARVPGQVEVEEIGAVALQVQPLAGGVGGDQDAERMVFRLGVEGVLDVLADRWRGRAGEDRDPFAGPVGVGDRFAEAAFEVAARVLVLGEDDDAPVVPPRGRGGLRLGPPGRRCAARG